MLELIYTSAPRLLEAGKTGFGTLRCSKGMPRPLISYLERISTFDRSSGVDVLEYYTSFKMGSVFFHVFSRAGDCGADYTGRTNHIAHHFVVEEGTPEADGLLKRQTPASVLMGLEGLWVTSCPSAPGHPEVRFPCISSPDSATSAWERLTGTREKARWMGLPPYREECCLAISEVARPSLCLQLLHEGYLCKQNNGWGCGFATACTGTLGANLVPVTCLDARQRSAGVTPGRAVSVLELTGRLPLPPACVGPVSGINSSSFLQPLGGVGTEKGFGAPQINPGQEKVPCPPPPPELMPDGTLRVGRGDIPLPDPPSEPPVSPASGDARRTPVFAIVAAVVILGVLVFMFSRSREEETPKRTSAPPSIASGKIDRGASAQRKVPPAAKEKKAEESAEGLPTSPDANRSPRQTDPGKSNMEEQKGAASSSADSAKPLCEAKTAPRGAAVEPGSPGDSAIEEIGPREVTSQSPQDSAAGEGGAREEPLPDEVGTTIRSCTEDSSPQEPLPRTGGDQIVPEYILLRKGDRGVEIGIKTEVVGKEEPPIFKVTLTAEVFPEAVREKGFRESHLYVHGQEKKEWSDKYRQPRHVVFIKCGNRDFPQEIEEVFRDKEKISKLLREEEEELEEAAKEVDELYEKEGLDSLVSMTGKITEERVAEERKWEDIEKEVKRLKKELEKTDGGKRQAESVDRGAKQRPSEREPESSDRVTKGGRDRDSESPARESEKDQKEQEDDSRERALHRLEAAIRECRKTGEAKAEKEQEYKNAVKKGKKSILEQYKERQLLKLNVIPQGDHADGKNIVIFELEWEVK